MYRAGLVKCHYTYVRENYGDVLSTFTYKDFEKRVVLSVRSTTLKKCKIRTNTEENGLFSILGSFFPKFCSKNYNLGQIQTKSFNYTASTIRTYLFKYYM